MEKEMDRLEHLLKQQDYESLSSEDKEWVSQFVASGEEYESMRRTTLALEEHFGSASGADEPDPAILSSLQRHLIKKKEESQPSRWTVPAWAAMLALFVAGGAGWYAGTAAGIHEVYVDRFVTKTDTVLVVSRPDTVVVERVLYRQVPTAIPASVVSQELQRQTPAAKGVNMKDKQELEKFLVSGGL